MAPETDNVLPKLIRGFKRIHQEYCKLVEDPTNGLPYQGGASLTPSDVATMRITFNQLAKTGFWEPADPSTRGALECAVEGPLGGAFSSLESLLNNRVKYKKKLISFSCPTIEDAYTPSTEYSRVLEQGVYWGLFHNEALVDDSGDNLFLDLRVSYGWSHIYMESREVFSSPGYPHITILSIQPQRAISQKELLCTEFWTLYYWAQKLIRRPLYTTNHSFPMRLVSLCGYEARVVSAVFSLGYPRSIVKEVGEGMHQSVKCQIHIAEYRDLSNRQELQDLLEELVATPCGNAEVQQKSPGKRNI